LPLAVGLLNGQKGRKTWAMEHFYREMREEQEILMSDGKPEGGR
jgi:deoxyribodipyrimidine photolyase-like uncharacterized protein